ncbi:MAG: HNH endonuclease [Firmicutes bacterium]|nr:HNH endonuclease [Bacillota bacterium]
MKSFEVEIVKKPLYIRNRKDETWKRFDEKHLLSSYGRWYSEVSKRIMKQFPNSSGYFRVKIGKKQIFTHIKVVEFFGDINGVDLDEITSLVENGLSIDHLNRNKKHNSIYNLEIVTHQINCIRRSRWNELAVS